MEKPSVLIVDDEKAYCDVVEELLRSFGMRSHVAKNVEQALELLEQENTDLIMLDVMMPHVDGATFLRWIRTHSYWKTLPVLIVSAKASNRDRIWAREAGADGFLAKPFTYQELEDALTPLLQMSPV
jgi:DNA-binding response OmpR family regulator